MNAFTSSLRMPDTLSAWQPWLSWFDVKLAEALLPILLRLEALTASLRGSHSTGEPEFIGLEDLRRRGPYERLLLSEWLYADEFPDEFLRRAAQGEHLFLEPAYRKPKRARTIYAIFDCGFEQLGAPRLLHVALWIVLARRAQQNQVSLWFAAASSPHSWRTANSADDLRWLLRQRTLEAFNVSACADAFQKMQGERWLIAPVHESASSFNADVVCAITPQLRLRADTKPESIHRSLLVNLRTAKLDKKLCIEVPDQAVPVLFGQFKRAAERYPRAQLLDSAPYIAVIFSSTAHRFALITPRNAADIFKPPHKHGNGGYRCGKQQWRRSGKPVALCFAQKRLCGIIRHDDENASAKYELWSVPGLIAPFKLELPFDEASVQGCLFEERGLHSRLLILSDGELWALGSTGYEHRHHAKPTPIPAASWLKLQSNVMAIGPMGSQFAFVHRTPEQLVLHAAHRSVVMPLYNEEAQSISLRTASQSVLYCAQMDGFIVTRELLGAGLVDNTRSFPFPSYRAVLLGAVSIRNRVSALLWNVASSNIVLLDSIQEQILLECPQPLQSAHLSPHQNQLVMIGESGAVWLLEIDSKRLTPLVNKDAASGDVDDQR